MTPAEIRSLLAEQVESNKYSVNSHSISLADSLVPPRRITVIERIVVKGRVRDRILDVWLVAQEPSTDGYRIVMRESDRMFGLASKGFEHDQHLVLVGWYGDLATAFASM
jgi:hypothetical protein